MLSILRRWLGGEQRAFVDQPLTNAWQPVARPSVDGLAALEAASGLYGRAFSQLRVSSTPAIEAGITPETLIMIGRELIRRGEVLFEIRVDASGLRLQPSSSWHVESRSPDPSSWTYFASFSAPSGSTYRRLPASGVVHARYAVDPYSPWKGKSPLAWAADTATFSTEIDDALRAELRQVSTAVIGLETNDPNEPGITPAESSMIADSFGSKIFRSLLPRDRRLPESLAVPSPAFGIPTLIPRKLSVERVGPEPASSTVSLRSDIATAIFAVLGLPGELVSGSADGTGAREAYRRFILASVEPLSRVVAAELSAKLESPVTLDAAQLNSADISGRARGFQSMVGGGMPLEQAAALAGLLAEDS